MHYAAAKSPDLNDDLSDLIGSPMRAEPAAAPAGFVPATERAFTEPCRKCAGSGRWRPGYPCFACKGTGKVTFKTAPETRAAKRTSTASSKLAKIEAFKIEHADVWAWMDGSTFPPAVEMREKLHKYGSLFDSSIAFAQRMIAKRDAAKQAAADRVTNAPATDTAGIDRLKAAFDKAAAATAAKTTETGMPLRLRSPRITIGTVTISPAKATSANAGALYVKDAGTYMGKIVGGKFIASRDCTPEQQTRILAFVADPAAAAKAYGQETGMCCICNATLTSKWRLAGIGPICATKFGW